jgi:hypothetical protein
MLAALWQTLTAPGIRATPTWHADSQAGTAESRRSCTGGSRRGFAFMASGISETLRLRTTWPRTSSS